MLPVILEESTDGPTSTFSLFVTCSLPYFDGHFPASPILPGFVLVMWALHFSQTRLGVDISFMGLRRVKFHTGVGPNSRIQLRIEAERDKIDFSYAFSQTATEKANTRQIATGAIIIHGTPRITV